MEDSRATASGIQPSAPPLACPIVALGCSAGGLDALERFFRHAGVRCGCAYVIVQHLARDHVSALPGILRFATPMPVLEVTDGQRVQPDCVYVIPPNKDLAVRHGVLHLTSLPETPGLRLPIDHFFQALANDQRERAIGVVLSGMGSDGRAGLLAIRAAGGLTLAQDPASAAADSMPRAAIQAQAVDIVASPEDLPGRISEFLAGPRVPQARGTLPEQAILGGLGKVIALLRERCGADFTHYKPNTLVRRITRRIAVHQLGGMSAYVELLRANPQEVNLLFRELLIGVTQFFRDPHVWEYLRAEAMPALLARCAPRVKLRAWVAGCSTGEEAYSLAMVLREAMADAGAGLHVEPVIYATDLDPEAIVKARRGLYPKSIAADVSADRLGRYFTEEEDGYRVKRLIREMVVFAPQNMVSDPPFTRLDILLCRNLLIYFSADLQRRVVPLMHYALNDAGLLLLGSAETPGLASHLFTPVNNQARLYRKVDGSLPITAIGFPAFAARGAPMTTDTPYTPLAENLGQLTDMLVQQDYAPAAVLINGEGDILYISGRTGRYLEPPAGKVNINIHAMARDGLRESLTGAIPQAMREPEPVQVRGLRVRTDGGVQTVNLIVRAIRKPPALAGLLLVVFMDAAAPPARRRGGRIAPTEAAQPLELAQARESMRTMHDQMQLTLEELKSSNEELQSTNEELQSTNEELTTSKEEMQSLNEELQTVNAELQSKVESLTRTQNDMTNLLNSTELATVFLDVEMRLRRYTPNATRLFKLIPGDVGRPLSDVASDLRYPDMTADAQEVLRTLAFQEKEVPALDERWFRVRIMPYRTQENLIDGVVITFTDISQLKSLQSALKSGSVVG